jgi:hypothetical protein
MNLLMLVLEPLVVVAFAKKRVKIKIEYLYFMNIPWQMVVVEVEDRVE